ncbi:class I SAM-dependent methyltransferase [Bacillaceae bacterium]
MIVTTAYDPDEAVVCRAKRLAAELRARYVARRKFSLNKIFRQTGADRAVVVSKEGAKLYSRGDDMPFFFHPGTAVVRIKRLKNGDNDSMIEACGLTSGDRFLDCTLGLGADSIVASYVVGTAGKVVGLESERVLAVLVADGLKRWSSDHAEMEEAMRRIEVIHEDHLRYLKHCPDNSFDVVYFDPMFRKPVAGSSGIAPLRRFANRAPLSEEAVREACRVASRCVVLKEANTSGEFARLGFNVLERPNASTVYGVIRTDANA